MGPPAPCVPILQPPPGKQRVNDAQGAAGSLFLTLSGTMGPLWETGQVWADPRTGSYSTGRLMFLPGSLSASSGRRRAGGCQPFCGPWKNTGQPSHRNTTSACPVALASNLTPTDTIRLGTKCSQTARDTKLSDDTSMQQTRL